MEKGVIYKITSPTGKIYIGQSKHYKNRISQYKRLSCKGQKKLYNSINKHGWDNHVFEIIEKIEHETHYYEITNTLEIYWISYYNSAVAGLNIDTGGKNHNNRKFSEEAKKNMSLAKLGRKNGPQTEDWKNNIGKANSVKIKCLTNNRIYNSLSDASRELDLQTTKISRVCKGQSEHTKGYKFEYISIID